MKYLFTLTGAIVGITLGYVFFTSPTNTLTSSTGIAESKSIAKLESDLIAIRKELVSLRSEQNPVVMNYQESNITRPGTHTLPQPIIETESTLSPTNHVSSNKVSEIQQVIQRKSTPIVTSLEHRLTTEDPDNHWETSLDSELADSLQRFDLVNTTLSSVECRASFCRVVLLHTDTDAEDKFMTNVPELPGMQDTELFYTRTELTDGSTEMTLYVAGQGQVLGLAEAGL